MNWLFNVTINDISVIYVTAHRCAGRLKLDLQSGPNVSGRPFDPEGGGMGWQFWSGQIIYFHHGLDRKIYFRVNRGQNIYFQPQQMF